jgi:hypothetical protein
MRVSEEPFCIYLFRQNAVFISLHLRSPVHVVPPQARWWYTRTRRTPWPGPPSISASPVPTRRSSSIHKRDCSRNSSTISGVLFIFISFEQSICGLGRIYEGHKTLLKEGNFFLIILTVTCCQASIFYSEGFSSRGISQVRRCQQSFKFLFLGFEFFLKLALQHSFSQSHTAI